MIGQTLGHYRIESKLGEGGMGVVYKALDTHLDRPVAIKVLTPEAASNPARRQRFVQEARAASALDHPNIITIYDIAEAEGQFFIAMQYVAGKTLREMQRRGRLPLNETLRYAIQTADALAQAHTHGIVHRDLKPENIMVSEQGQVKILDFGLAKLTERSESDESAPTETLKPHTEEGTILGTVAYMSPEQAEGKKVDRRSDIFSFGSVLYEMVTGRRAFSGETRMSTLAAILHHDPKPPTELVDGLPRELERVINRCLRKDPGRRFQDMEDLNVALEELKEESDSGKLDAVGTPGRKRFRSLPLAAAVLAVIIAGGGRWLFLRPAAKPLAQPFSVVPLTSYPGSERSPTFSPDSNQFAFSWNGEKQDNFDIYVRLVEGGTPLRLTTNPAADEFPAWSPDGRQIAFARAGVGIFLISPLGGPERKLADFNAGFLAWTPDGKSLAAVERADTGGTDLRGRSIFLFPIAEGEKRKLTGASQSYWGDDSFAFSPDGKMLAFARWPTATSSDLHLVPLGGGEIRRLTHEEKRILGMAWAPKGRELIYQVGTGGLQRIGVDEPNARPQQVPGVESGAQFPTIARSGSRLAYERTVNDTNIWITEIAHLGGPGKKPTQVIASTRSETSPQFSPDGNKIAFASDRSGQWQVYVADRDGGNVVQITSLGDVYCNAVRWSPDGRYLAFAAMIKGNRDIYVVGVDGGATRRLTSEPSEEGRPSWSRDGRWIYFYSSRTGRLEVWKMPAEGGKAEQVTTGGGHESFESPNGKVLYYSKPVADGALWSVPLGTPGEGTLVLEAARQGHWAIADKGIYFVDFNASNDYPWAVKFLEFESRRITQVAVIEKPIARPSPGFTATRDGRWLAWEQIDHRDSDLMLVENFH